MDEKFEAIVKQNIKLVYNFAFRLSQSQGDASDITQEAFVKVWKNLGKFDTDKNLKTWILAITRNTVIDWLRKRKNISFSKLDSLMNQSGDTENKKFFSETLADIEPLPDEIFERKELKEDLEKAMSKLRPDFVEIIFLHYTEGLSFQEISEITCKPLNTVKSHHLRALSALRKLLVK